MGDGDSDRGLDSRLCPERSGNVSSGVNESPVGDLSLDSTHFLPGTKRERQEMVTSVAGVCQQRAPSHSEEKKKGTTEKCSGRKLTSK